MPKESLNKIDLPPQNLDAELSVLGSLLLDADAIVKVADILSSEDFYVPENAILYQAVLKLYEKRSPIDLVTLSERLEAEKKLKQIGGATYLSSLLKQVPTAAHVVRYAQIVRDKAVLRRLISAGNKIIELGFREEEEVDKVLDLAQQSVFSVSQKYQKGEFLPIRDILAESFDRIDRLHREKGVLRGVSTGFRDLDNILAGLQNSDLIVLAARPSMGKSSLALNIAQHAAVSEKIPVAIFSLEMSKEQLVDRMLVSESGVDSWKLRTGNLSEEDFPKIGYAMGVLSEAPIFVDDSPLLSVMEIRTKSRRLAVEQKLGLIVVDYLQLMESSSRRAAESRVQEISEISRGLKALARELNVPVLAISQLSRAVEMRSPKIPQLADLRESGTIEQDSDVVMFIYREDYYDPDSERKNMADILIKKHRNGPTGQVELYFAPEQMKFKSVEKKREEVAVEK